MAQPTTFSESQALTRAAPTLATEGMSLKGLSSVTLIVETATPASQTFSGAGSMLCYVFDPSVNAWSRLPSLDFSVSTSGVARIAFDAVEVVGPRNARVLWATSGVTVSAGSTVTVYQLGHAPALQHLYR